MALKAVIIDTNERAVAPWITLLDFGVPTLYQSLPCGDCWLATDKYTIVVERKTPMDLLASIADGRLFEQCTAMMVRSEWCYICVTGYYTIKTHHVVIERQETQWKDRQVEGALLNVQELGVHIIRCDGDTDYRDTLMWLAERERGEIRIKPRRQNVPMSVQENVLNSLQADIGPVKAAALFKQHNSLARALVGLTKLDTDEHTPGIGTGIRQAVRTTMQLAADEEMLVAKGGLTAIDLTDIDDKTLGTILADNLGSQTLAKICEKANELDELKGSKK